MLTTVVPVSHIPSVGFSFIMKFIKLVSLWMRVSGHCQNGHLKALAVETHLCMTSVSQEDETLASTTSQRSGDNQQH